MMELAGAEFETSRLRVEEWHTRASRTNLVEFVMRLLTPEVTKALPPSWHGSYDRERAEAWIAERDEESAVLLVSEIATNKPVGLVLLGENRTKRRWRVAGCSAGISPRRRRVGPRVRLRNRWWLCRMVRERGTLFARYSPASP